MSLTESIKRASQQQPSNKDKNVEHINPIVNLGVGRISPYELSQDGRPTYEGYTNSKSNGESINE